MTLKIDQISKQLSKLAIIFFLIIATFFNEIIFTLIRFYLVFMSLFYR